MHATSTEEEEEALIMHGPQAGVFGCSLLLLLLSPGLNL